MKTRANQKLLVLLSPLAVIALLGAYANANTRDSLDGKWIGNSRIDGDKSLSKTELKANFTEASLRIEGSATCVLKTGKYAASNNETWQISFDEVSGGDVCSRLAKGVFTFQRGSNTRQLVFQVTYPGADGQENKGRGVLNHYP